MRILVIDDDANGAETVRRTLVAEGWVVDVVDNGDDGLLQGLHGRYQAIVCDIMMPGLNGYEVVRRLRSEQVWTPVLMLTAKDGDYDEIDAFDLGADDYLTKPFSVEVLVARLRAVIRRAGPGRAAVLTAGSLTLDPAAHVVRRRGSEISLTPKEFGVLEFLLQNAGVAVTKAEILQAVWDSNFDGDLNVVEVYIGYLRKRVDRPFGCASIETVRGVGYRLVAVD
ncbi:response regulator transcription factor [Williamsia serinedens]|uniref:Two-component system, OmpR family, response regulator n=1 Tax=Williamsia serinedens TaxID=391736 RepID=A0ABT1H017_9NOCA|nr:response regulator transcription factor [Williamsia serinedens]MCP2160589.1 two-component system, OmpR family, response regulator [Williamsia serinedens]